MNYSQNISADDVVTSLQMGRLPVESTFYKSTHIGEIDPKTNNPLATAILALYAEKPLSCSLFHKLKHDEMWHFYAGDPIQLHLIYPDGTYKKKILGDAIENLQFVIPKNVWQAGELVPGGNWGLFGCTMSPGFVGAEFTGGYRAELMALAPQCEDIIKRLAVPNDHDNQMPEGFIQ
jgi:predicted cupin superfamily sugar epimerase